MKLALLVLPLLAGCAPLAAVQPADPAALALASQPPPQPQPARARPQRKPPDVTAVKVRARSAPGPQRAVPPPIKNGDLITLRKGSRPPCRHAVVRTIPRAGFFVPGGTAKFEELFRKDDRLMVLCERRAWWVIDKGGYWRQIAGAREH